jgi:hypothetical protein
MRDYINIPDELAIGANPRLKYMIDDLSRDEKQLLQAALNLNLASAERELKSAKECVAAFQWHLDSASAHREQ